MTNKLKPNPKIIFPVKNCKTVTHIKPTIKNKNIIVGVFSYFSDVDFEKHVTHHYDFIGDKLIIGKFCQIGKGVEFVMNGANHKMDCISTYPFYIMSSWNQNAPKLSELPIKGDTIVGNDVWIGQNCTILPGVHIGDGAIIGLNSTVASDIPPYSIAVGNPARVIKKRFNKEIIDILLKLKWWDKNTEDIQKIIPLLTSSSFKNNKNQIKKILNKFNKK